MAEQCKMCHPNCLYYPNVLMDKGNKEYIDKDGVKHLQGKRYCLYDDALIKNWFHICPATHLTKLK